MKVFDMVFTEARTEGEEIVVAVHILVLPAGGAAWVDSHQRGG